MPNSMYRTVIFPWCLFFFWSKWISPQITSSVISIISCAKYNDHTVWANLVILFLQSCMCSVGMFVLLYAVSLLRLQPNIFIMCCRKYTMLHFTVWGKAALMESLKYCSVGFLPRDRYKHTESLRVKMKEENSTGWDGPEWIIGNL